MTQTIKFELTQKFEQPILPPVATKRLTPAWLKKMNTGVSKHKLDEWGNPMQTVKKCVPFVDAITAGYTLLTHIDLNLTLVNDELRVVFLDDEHEKKLKEFNPVETHPRLQVEGTPFEDFRILKYITPWKIKVPDGWSLLFLPPMNQFELSYIPLCGLVDADTYDGVVNFPFICPNIGEGVHVMIPAGSPFIQIIPVKRDEWKEEIVVYNEEQYKQHKKYRDHMHANKKDYYRKNAWQKKKYT